jgi:hypothetical protein
MAASVADGSTVLPSAPAASGVAGWTGSGVTAPGSGAASVVPAVAVDAASVELNGTASAGSDPSASHPFVARRNPEGGRVASDLVTLITQAPSCLTI